MKETKRIGLIIPSPNTILEPDFYRITPRNITTHSARMWVTSDDPRSVEKMNQEVENCAKCLATASVDIIAYGCTAGSFLFGLDYDRKLTKRITAICGVPVVTVIAASLESFRNLGLKSIFVASPYSDDVNMRLVNFLKDNGFKVSNIVSSRVGESYDSSRQTPDSIYIFSRKACANKADGIFLACTNWRALEAADRLEKELDKPVITASQALIWSTLRTLGFNQSIKGYGRLMESRT